LLDRPGPIGNLLDLIENKVGGRALDFGLDAGGFPMGADPGGVLKGWLIGAVEKGWLFAGFDNLLDQGGFAHLPWSGDNLKKSPRLGKPLIEDSGLGSLVGIHEIYSMY
jgi:hypothetical protein